MHGLLSPTLSFVFTSDDEDMRPSVSSQFRPSVAFRPSMLQKRTSRALSVTRLSKLASRDSLTPLPTKEDFAMDREVDLFKQNQFDRFSELMYFMDNWFHKYRRQVRVALSTIYKTRYWSSSYTKFKSKLRDLGAPCNAFEMHVICRVLDHLDIRRVSYKHCGRSVHPLLSHGLGIRRPKDQFSVPDLSTKPVIYSLAEEEKQYVNILFVYGPLYDIYTHPGHFREVVSMDTYVYNLKQIIEKRLGLVTRVRILYGIRFIENASTLPWTYTLLELGYEGGPFKFPKSLTLYYDITTANQALDCPLILASHYYLKDLEKKKEPVLERAASFFKENLTKRRQSQMQRMGTQIHKIETFNE